MSAIIQKVWTVNEIKTANRVAGFHWFDPDTMRCFGTRVLDEVYDGPGGIFFVTSDKAYDDSRGYTVRGFDPATGSVSSASEVAAMTKAQAIRTAKEKAAHIPFGNMIVRAELGGPPMNREVKVTSEQFRPVSVLEQFVGDLRTHGSSTASPGDAREMIQLAAKHHSAMERECNYGNQFGADGEPRSHLRKIRERLTELAARCGAASVVFSDDPRGVTVRLTFADGATNDFAKEGWIVPTSEKV